MKRLISYFPPAAFKMHIQKCQWQQAIEISMEALLANNIIEQRYITAIKHSTQENGAYYILTPEIAMPHARPEEGAKETGLTLTLFPAGVYFNDDNPRIKVLIGLAARDADSHINAIQLLSEMFCDDHLIEQLTQAQDVQVMRKIVQRF
jgi:mannitol/fructose-specific phosphotransferase system IIA component (Ntr-type)